MSQHETEELLALWRNWAPAEPTEYVLSGTPGILVVVWKVKARAWQCRDFEMQKISDSNNRL